MHVWHKGPKGGPAGEAGAQLTECGGWNVAQCAAFWWLHGRTVLQNGMFSFFFCTKGQPRASGGRVALHRRRFVLTGGQSTAADEQRTSADDGQRSLMGWCSVEIEASWNPAFFFRHEVQRSSRGQWASPASLVCRAPRSHPAPVVARRGPFTSMHTDDTRNDGVGDCKQYAFLTSICFLECKCIVQTRTTTFGDDVL
mmetsp:Transcript_53525/g.88176  ORF Transcript_53525/g.88176 Transcript_53525/m.88176 type:complete len:198 (-) Transcript_53525:40-633(-)